MLMPCKQRGRAWSSYFFSCFFLSERSFEVQAVQEGWTGLGKVRRRSRLPFAAILVGLVYSPFMVNLEILSMWVCLYKSLKNLAAWVCFLSSYVFKEVLSNELDFSNSGLLSFLRIESKLYFASYYHDLLFVYSTCWIPQQNVQTACSTDVLFWIRTQDPANKYALGLMHWLEIGTISNRCIKKEKKNGKEKNGWYEEHCSLP